MLEGELRWILSHGARIPEIISAMLARTLVTAMAVSKSLRFQILRRDNHTCRYCGRSAPEVKLTVDHVLAEALGGSDEPENLTAACEDCNSGKSATPPDAATVAQVSADALRWAHAHKLAIEQILAEHAGEQAMRDAFMGRWKEWAAGPRAHAYLNPGWRNSLDSFLSAGLPIELVLQALDAAMDNRRVRDTEVFRYFCGVAWSKVKQVNAATSEILASEERGSAPEWVTEYEIDLAYDEGRADLVRDILGDDYESEEMTALTARARKRAEEDGLDMRMYEDTDAHMLSLVLQEAFIMGYEEHADLDSATARLIGSLTPGIDWQEFHALAVRNVEGEGAVATASAIRCWQIDALRVALCRQDIRFELMANPAAGAA